MNDVKQTLATAFHDEPPMVVDKAAIVRKGRRKLAIRRGSTAVAVLAAAAVVVLPTTLTTTGGDAAVGASPSQSAPPVYGIPIPSHGPLPPSPKPVTAERAAELTASLRDSGAVPAGAEFRQILDQPGGDGEFAPAPVENWAGYRMTAAVRTARGDGPIHVSLTMGQGHYPRSCADPGLVTQSGPCEESTVDGRKVVVEDTATTDSVVVWNPDGSVVLAQTSDAVPGEEHTPGRPAPLSVEELVNLATQPWLTY